MRAEMNHARNYIEFDGKIFHYKNFAEQERTLNFTDFPTFTFDRPGLFGAGEMHISVNGKQIDNIPYYSKEGPGIEKVLRAYNQAKVAEQNRDVNKDDPNATIQLDGIKVSNSVFWMPNLISLAKNVIHQDEVLQIALSGMFKEYLIVTDKTLYILKSGFMTGHLTGNGSFIMPLDSVTNTSVDFHLMSGYFTVSTAGMENTQKNFWSQDKQFDPAKSPNTISLGADSKRNFIKASQMINTRLIPAARRAIGQPIESQRTRSSADRIRQYKALLDDGIITQTEFEGKKKQLLESED